MPLDAGVQSVVDAYLDAVDRESPGLVEGLYLTGSIALHDYRPLTSDIDYLAVTSRAPDAAAVAALDRAHAQVRSRFRRPHFDGRYVTRDDLARSPRQAAPGPYTYAGRFRARGQGDCNPVAWHTLAKHGVRCRGPEPGDLAILLDPVELASWTLDNFDSYWRPLLRRARRFPDPWSLISFTSYGATWIVLGVCRLHFTLATGNITSKEQAGDYGLETFGERWHSVLNEALRIRRADRARPMLGSAISEMVHDLAPRTTVHGGPLYATPSARRRDVLAFADMVVVDAKHRFGRGAEVTLR
jgi:hypothetical protein